MSGSGNFWSEKVLPYVPRIIRHDFWRKLFAFVFAVLLAIYAHRNVKMKMEMVKMTLKDVPVQFVPARGESFTLVQRAAAVDVDVELPGGELKDLKNTDLYVECPVAFAQIERNVAELNINMVRRVRRIDNLIVHAVHPDAIELNLDYYDEMDVPLEPVYDPKEVMDGYRVIEVKPEKQVRIRGPRSLLAGISELKLKTEKIPLSNGNKGFSCLVHPVLPYEVKNGDVRILSDTVRVEVRIKKNDPISIPNVPVRVITGTEGANSLAVTGIRPESVTVKIEDVPNISPEQIHPFLDLSGIKGPGVYTVDIKCWADNDKVKIVEMVPATATVTLESVWK